MSAVAGGPCGVLGPDSMIKPTTTSLIPKPMPTPMTLQMAAQLTPGRQELNRAERATTGAALGAGPTPAVGGRREAGGNTCRWPAAEAAKRKVSRLTGVEAKEGASGEGRASGSRSAVGMNPSAAMSARKELAE